MFVQIIEGRTNDAAGLRRTGEEWQEKLRPGAIGFVGATAGVTADGRAITVAVFDSPESAKANSERPEQGAFFEQISKYYVEAPTFTESTDVEEFLGGINPAAKFVQIMKANGVDRVKVKELDVAFEKLSGQRPDVIGMFRVWTSPDSSVEAVYFTDEAAARAGESQELTPELQALMTEFGDQMQNTEYLDLVDPSIH